MIKFSGGTIEVTIPNFLPVLVRFWQKYELTVLTILLSLLSVVVFAHYLNNGLGLSYNDARSHLDIGRRVVEGLKPGLAQLGSVWLPLPHLLMVPTIWVDAFWHTGFAGALQSMIFFVITALVIDKYLKLLGAGATGRLVGVLVFVVNLNILYLQSIAMTEILLLGTMTVGVYELTKWHKTDEILALIRAAFWIMLSTLVRYDGWFLLFFAAFLILARIWRRRGFSQAEGTFILFCTLGGFGVFLWLLWNQLIFKDALYFAFGPFSARAQQKQLEDAGMLLTKGNWLASLQTYLYALFYNSGAFTAVLGAAGAVALWLNRKISARIRFASLALLAPLMFNVLALYLGHSVLFIQGINGDTWFNVRYGIMMLPSIAIFVGFLVDRAKPLRWVIIGLLAFVSFFAIYNSDAVTLDDARVGSSQKNVTEVSGWLDQYTKNEKGFILISAASHDAIIFSSGLPMKRFIHEGTGKYWESATTTPDRWARWIVMRSYDDNDLVWKAVSRVPGFIRYEKMAAYPFADVYQLKDEFLRDLQTEPVIGKQR